MALLHIYDSSDWTIRLTAGRRDIPDHIAADNEPSLVKALDALLAAGSRFDRILFETHGSPGTIYFGEDEIDEHWLRLKVPKQYTQLTTADARVYFNGCNVAEGTAGWRFLEASAALFLTPGGGQVFGQTSVGLGNPVNGHVVHLWGDTRTLFVDRGGRIVERFEQ